MIPIFTQDYKLLWTCQFTFVELLRLASVVLSHTILCFVGRKCVCTSKACKEAGVDTCKTRFFCYTERILTARQEIGESTVTRGCTECVYHKLLTRFLTKIIYKYIRCTMFSTHALQCLKCFSCLKKIMTLIIFFF